MKKIILMLLTSLILQGCLATKSSIPLREFQQDEYEHIAGAENILLNCYKSGYTDIQFTKTAIMSLMNNVKRQGYFDNEIYQNTLNKHKNKTTKVDEETCLDISIYGQENIEYDNAHKNNELINQQLTRQYEEERKIRYIQNMNQSLKNLNKTYIDSITPKPTKTINCYHNGSMTTCY